MPLSQEGVVVRGAQTPMNALRGHKSDGYQTVLKANGLSQVNAEGECRITERMNMTYDIPENGHLTLIFKPTYTCNLACPYCYNEGWRDSAKFQMSKEEATNTSSNTANQTN